MVVMDTYYGQFSELAPLLVLLNRLRVAALDAGGVVWLLPPETLPGVTSAYGLPVVRVELLTEPMLGVRPE